MAEVAKQLQSIVDGIARTGALTPDAIRQFDELKQRCDELSARLTSEVASREKANNDYLARSREVTELASSLATMTKRATDAEAKNVAADRAIWIAEFEKERRAELRSIVGDVFRNAEVMRQISHTVPVVIPPSYPGGMHTTQYQSDTRTETETRK